MKRIINNLALLLAFLIICELRQPLIDTASAQVPDGYTGSQLAIPVGGLNSEYHSSQYYPVRKWLNEGADAIAATCPQAAIGIMSIWYPQGCWWERHYIIEGFSVYDGVQGGAIPSSWGWGECWSPTVWVNEPSPGLESYCVQRLRLDSYPCCMEMAPFIKEWYQVWQGGGVPPRETQDLGTCRLPKGDRSNLEGPIVNNNPNNITSINSSVNLKSGNVYHSQQVGPLSFSYNSLDQDTGPLGTGWKQDFSIKITVIPGEGLYLKESDGNKIWFRVEDTGIYHADAKSRDKSTIIKNTDGSFTRTARSELLTSVKSP